ncbi:MAG: SpoIIIAH-like family protein [Thermaerobacter sp.]|nr:SpoIIIAH-like family protein [Thermaerobacter sp.]
MWVKQVSKRDLWRFGIFLLVLVLIGLYVWAGQRPAGRSGGGPAMVQSQPAATSGSLAAYRLDWQTVQSREMDLLRRLSTSGDSAALRQQAGRQLLDMTRRMAWETEIDDVLRAKGFPGAMTMLQSQSAVVVVRGGNLDAARVAQIADIVEKTAGLPPQDLAVVPAR